MRCKVQPIAFVVACVAGLLLAGCKKSESTAQTNPHSLDGVMDQIIQHVGLLEDAARRKDFKYVHDYAYYVKNLAQALYSHLDDEQKAQAKQPLADILKVVNQLDAASGRKHEEATLAGTQRLQEILKDLDAQLRQGRKTSSRQRASSRKLDRTSFGSNLFIQSHCAV